jgi:two-component system, response regulator PdtaR
MSVKVLIVEDEFLVAVNLQAVIEDLGYATVGIAADKPSALSLADDGPDVALVDLNLRDGPTGPEIGALLSRMGVSVLYVTANPRMLGDGVPGTLGVMTKPCRTDEMRDGLSYAINHRMGISVPPPPGVTPFGPTSLNN